MEPNNEKSPSFGKVFSTTGKVILAIVLISACLAAGAAMLGVFGSVITRSSSSSKSLNEEMKGSYTREAERAPTSMPLSAWKYLVSLAVKEHCAFVGMTEADMEASLKSVPAKRLFIFTDPDDSGTEVKKVVYTDKSFDWLYQATKHICEKYNGDVCVQQHDDTKEEGRFHFTPNGIFAYVLESGANSWDEKQASGQISECFDEVQPLVEAYMKANTTEEKATVAAALTKAAASTPHKVATPH
jgi:hypothetical protein